MNPNLMMASLYVGDLHPDVTESMLEERFSSAGHIHSIRVCRDRKTGSSCGYAYINFQQRANAERALEMLNMELLMGQPMRVMWQQKDPSQRKNGIGNIFIRNLDKSIDSMALHDIFSMFGKVLSCKAVGYETGPKGYGYVQFESVEEADMAIQTLNGKLLNGHKVFIEHFKVREARQGDAGSRPPLFTNIYVKNLGEEMDEKMLADIFSKIGPILRVSIVTDVNGKSRGFGFVQFERHEDAQRAVTEMKGKLLNGKTLYLDRALTKMKKQSPPKQMSKQVEEMDCLLKASAEDTSPEPAPPAGPSPAPASFEVPDLSPDEKASPNPTSPAVPSSTPAAVEISGLEDPVAAPSKPLEFDEVTYPLTRELLTSYILDSPVEHDQLAYNDMLPLVEKIHPTLARKITWKLLEGQNIRNLLKMIRDPGVLHAKVNEIDALLKTEAKDKSAEPPLPAGPCPAPASVNFLGPAPAEKASLERAAPAVPSPTPAAVEGPAPEDPAAAPSKLTEFDEVTYPLTRELLTSYILESPVEDDQLAYNYMLPLVEKIYPTQARKFTWMLLKGKKVRNLLKMIRDPALLCAKLDVMDALLKTPVENSSPDPASVKVPVPAPAEDTDPEPAAHVQVPGPEDPVAAPSKLTEFETLKMLYDDNSKNTNKKKTNRKLWKKNKLEK